MTSAILDFVRQHAKAARTNVRLEETVTLTLAGLPEAYTPAALAGLAPLPRAASLVKRSWR